jgi:hypothetical protein
MSLEPRVSKFATMARAHEAGSCQSPAAHALWTMHDVGMSHPRPIRRR